MVDIDKVVAAGKLQVDWAAANRYDHNGKALSDLLKALEQSQKRVAELEGLLKESYQALIDRCSWLGEDSLPPRINRALAPKDGG